MSNPEQFNNPEHAEISDNALIELLRSGAEKPEAQELLQAFCEQEEKKVELADSKEASINFNVRLGQIYVKAGYTEEGLYSLECALTQAQHENLAELYDNILEEIKKLKTL